VYIDLYVYVYSLAHVLLVACSVNKEMNSTFSWDFSGWTGKNAASYAYTPCASGNGVSWEGEWACEVSYTYSDHHSIARVTRLAVLFTNYRFKCTDQAWDAIRYQHLVVYKHSAWPQFPTGLTFPTSLQKLNLKSFQAKNKGEWDIHACTLFQEVYDT
jgi:hypothetical protein